MLAGMLVLAPLLRLPHGRRGQPGRVIGPGHRLDLLQAAEAPQ
jgi:hypothetical protein